MNKRTYTSLCHHKNSHENNVSTQHSDLDYQSFVQDSNYLLQKYKVNLDAGDIILQPEQPTSVSNSESCQNAVFFSKENNSCSITGVVVVQSKRMGHSTVAYNGKLFVIGGCNKNEGILSSVEVYSNVPNQFSFVSSMKIPRSFFGSCLINSKLYAIGGQSIIDGERSGYIDEVEIYDIKSDIWMKGPKLPLAITLHSCNSNVTL